MKKKNKRKNHNHFTSSHFDSGLSLLSHKHDKDVKNSSWNIFNEIFLILMTFFYNTHKLPLSAWSHMWLKMMEKLLRHFGKSDESELTNENEKLSHHMTNSHGILNRKITILHFLTVCTSCNETRVGTASVALSDNPQPLNWHISQLYNENFHFHLSSAPHRHHIICMSD